MTITNDTLRLAHAFGDRVQAEFTPKQFRLICDLNKGKYADLGVCATHDFCDANMLMLAAFEEVFKRNPLDGPGGHMTQADTDLWNDAWTIAKETEFYA
jgi:hypothetical protein